MTLLDQLAKIREMQGRTAIDPTHIEGEAVPVPPIDYGALSPSAAMAPPENLPDFSDEPEPPPKRPTLLPEREPLRPIAPTPEAPVPELLVVAAAGHPCAAHLRGHEVALSDKERHAIERVVLGAFSRWVREQKPARQRRGVTQAGMGTSGPAQELVSAATTSQPRVRRVRRKSIIADGAR